MVNSNRARFLTFSSILLVLALALTACAGSQPKSNSAHPGGESSSIALAAESPSNLTPTVKFELVTGFRMAAWDSRV
jgi:ABC-type transport system substrate-binding protein